MELLAPAGDWCMLRAAVQAGADAVYFGVRGWNMRAAAANFSVEELKEVVDFCHQNNIKAYCTVNVIIFEKELEKLNLILQQLKEAKIGAVVCWDPAVIKNCRELGINVHLSTQASVSNSQAAKWWQESGVKRIVLARECSLEDVKEIKEKTNLEIECFVHGARCISLSGRCFLSHELFSKSANRGECLQPCRREYRITDEEGREMLMENNFVLSAKDLCALPLLPKLIGLGVDSFKIEGRNRGADYVHQVVSVYRKALEAIKNNTFNEDLVQELTEQLKEVYNKGFSRGFYVDYPHHQKADFYGSQATTEKVQLGRVGNFYHKLGVAEFKVECEGFKLGDKLSFVGPTTGYHEQIIEEIHHDRGKIEEAGKGEVVSVKLDKLVRIGDKVFLIKNRTLG